MCFQVYSFQYGLVFIFLFELLPVFFGWYFIKNTINIVFHKTFYRGQLLVPYSQFGTAGKQSLGVRMLGVFKNCIHSALFHYDSLVHHQHIVRYFSDNTQVVRDKNYAHLVFLLQVLHQFDDVFLHGYVQCGGGLIGNQQRRRATHGYGYHNALTLSSRQLMRIGTIGFHGVGQHDFFEPLKSQSFGFFFTHMLMQHNCFVHLPATFVNGIKRGHRLLKNHGQFGAPEFPFVFFGQGQDVRNVACFIGKQGLSGSDF